MSIRIIILFVLIVILFKSLLEKRNGVLSSEEEKKMNYMIKLIILRGLINPSCYWMDQSDETLTDKSGVITFNLIKSRSKESFVPINIFNLKLFLVTDIKYIEQILQNSPNPFNVGKLKSNFFKSFMARNLGVSQGKAWKRRRKLNEETLYTDRKHEFTEIFDNTIRDLIATNDFNVFDDFLYLSKKLATKIVFNREEIADEIFDFFKEVNNIKHFSEKYKSPKSLRKNYFSYMRKNIINTQKDSLLEIAKRHEDDVTELLHQIPHWVFPIAAIVNSIVPRLMLLLFNHREKLNRVVDEIAQYHKEENWGTLFQLRYLRQCILEILRLNNNVVSLFRTLETDFKFDDKYSFPKGTQFAIFTNPILRSSEYFDKPDEFIPERWTYELEYKYLPAISFSRGPQKCPGKDLTLIIGVSFITHLLKYYFTVA